MVLANIYGLFDPRDPDVICYVGKGNVRRAQSHWKRFLRTGQAVNARMRRGFGQLKTARVEPGWHFIAENVADWKKAERVWIAAWRILNSNLWNIANGGNDPSYLNPGLGGRVSHKLHPNKARDFGKKYGAIGARRAHALHPEMASINGKKNVSKPGFLAANGRRTHALHPEQAIEWNRKYAAEAGRIGAPIANHRRWHIRRNKTSSACALCQQ